MLISSFTGDRACLGGLCLDQDMTFLLDSTAYARQPATAQIAFYSALQTWPTDVIEGVRLS